MSNRCCFPIGLVAAHESTDILTTFSRPVVPHTEPCHSGYGLIGMLVPVKLV